MTESIKWDEFHVRAATPQEELRMLSQEILTNLLTLLNTTPIVANGPMQLFLPMVMANVSLST